MAVRARTSSGNRLLGPSTFSRVTSAVLRAYKAKFGKPLSVLVHSSNTPLDKTAALFRDAAVVVGLHGPGFVNLVFARPGTRVLELYPSQQAGDDSEASSALVDVSFSSFAQSLDLVYSRAISEGTSGLDDSQPLEFTSEELAYTCGVLY